MVWKRIEDEDNIRNVWICRKCEKLEYVHPDAYAEVGIPMCSECDEEMQYLYTEINED